MASREYFNYKLSRHSILQPAVLLCNSDSSALIINDNSLEFYLKLK